MQDLLRGLNELDSKLEAIPVEKLARCSGFLTRSARKAEPMQWLKTICLFGNQPIQNFRTFAWLLGMVNGTKISKQTVGKRIHRGFEGLMRECLSYVIAKFSSCSPKLHCALKGFSRVIVQDSTVIALPQHMAKSFPGTANMFSNQYASMRIQAFVDLLSESCLHLSISAFTRNDQRASADIFECARSGDLVIRDLGYYCLDVLERLGQQNISFISRLRQGTNLYDLDHRPMDLLALLKKKKTLDQWVLIGAQKKLKVRILAIALPQQVAAQRRRKAKADRDRRINHSKKYMQLLGWNILITSVPEQQMPSESVANTYQLRWRIETIFKTYKSVFQIDQFPPRACGALICSLVYAKLIYLSLFQCLFQSLNVQVQNSCSQFISIGKLASLVRNLPQLQLRSIIDSMDPKIFVSNTIYHCVFDTRKGRNHHFQKIQAISLG